MSSSHRFGPERATPPPRAFGSLLRHHRILAGLTQEALAERAGLSARAISDLERGLNRTPQAGTLDLLAKALHLEGAERADFEAAARQEKLQEPPNLTLLAPVSLEARRDGSPDQPATSDEPEGPARRFDEGELKTTHTGQRGGQESGPPQRLLPLPARHPRTSLVLGLLALLAIVAASSGLAYWQKLWPFDQSEATPPPPPGYIYAQPTHTGGALTFSAVGFPASTNPWFAGMPQDYDLIPALWGVPFTNSPTGTYLPDELTRIPTLANGDVSKDGRTVTLRLRHDLRWSDGQPLTADDFVYWIDVAMDPAAGTNIDLGPLDTYHALDTHTLVLHYKQLFVSYLFYLPMAAPRHFWGSIPDQDLSKRDDVNLYPTVTSGPFMIDRNGLQSSQRVTMVPNPYYRSTTLHKSVLDKLIFTTYADLDTLLADFQAGKTEFSDTAPLFPNLPRVSGLPGYHISTNLAYAHLDFNLSHSALQDELVRKAIEDAIDRCALIGTVFQQPCANLQVDTILTAPSPAYDPSIKTFSFNLAQAKQDMQAAGWDCSSSVCTRDGKPFPTLNLATRAGQPLEQTAELIQQNLAALGIPVQIYPYSFGQIFGDYTSGGILAHGQYDLSIYFTIFGLDPDGSLYSLFDSSQIPSASNPSGGNYERVSNPIIDGYLDQGRKTLDGSARTQLYKDLQRELVDRVYVVPLYLRPNLALVNSTIGNEQDNPTNWGNLWNVGDWFLTQ